MPLAGRFAVRDFAARVVARAQGPGAQGLDEPQPVGRPGEHFRPERRHAGVAGHRERRSARGKAQAASRRHSAGRRAAQTRDSAAQLTSFVFAIARAGIEPVREQQVPVHLQLHDVADGQARGDEKGLEGVPGVAAVPVRPDGVVVAVAVAVTAPVRLGCNSYS